MKAHFIKDDNNVYRAIVIAKDSRTAGELFGMVNRNYVMDNFLGTRNRDIVKSLIPTEPSSSCIIIIP